MTGPIRQTTLFFQNHSYLVSSPVIVQLCLFHTEKCSNICRLTQLHTCLLSDSNCFCVISVKEEDLYAFLYNPHQNEEDRRQGWEFISVANDFSRMGLSNEYWEISHLNKNYEVASSYYSTI